MPSLSALRQNWATPASVGLHALVIVGFLIQFAQPAPSFPADTPIPSLAVEVLLMPTPTPDIVNSAPPPPPPPSVPEVVEEPPPVITSLAEVAPPAPPPIVKKQPEPLKPTPVKRPPVQTPEAVPTERVAESTPLAVPATVLPAALPANQLALAAPAGRAGPPPDYQALVSALLARNKIYPREARNRSQQGLARLRFVIDRNGNLLKHELVSSSGHKLLDEEVLALIKRISPLPPLPADSPNDTFEMTAPINFSLR